MASDFSTFCDAVIDDLQANVRALADVRVHRYAPWDPEERVADGGERHLAVFPTSDEAEVAQRLVTGPGGDLLTQTYRIIYWEDAGDESSRGVQDEQATAALFELHNAIRTRLYAVANARLGGTELTTYQGTVFPDRSGLTRWFAMGLTARHSASVS